MFTEENKNVVYRILAFCLDLNAKDQVMEKSFSSVASYVLKPWASIH